MADLASKSVEALQQELATLRENLRSFRFSGAGSRSRNVREGRGLRKEIARILTELRARVLVETKPARSGLARPGKIVASTP